MKLTLDILLGLGLAEATGIRPFLPALVAGAAARANVLVDFGGTHFAFLESSWWLVAMAALGLVGLILRNEIAQRPQLVASVQGIGMGMGALLFCGALADDGYTWWPGIPAGLAAAWVSGTAVRDVFGRAAVRLDDEARSHLPVYGEGVAILLAALSIIAPPVSLVALAFFVWLLIGGRRRRAAKYEGLRSLR
ncbi:MAG TPA: DUF4126 family protein [Solirubrobacteraceae bacterium]